MNSLGTDKNVKIKKLNMPPGKSNFNRQSSKICIITALIEIERSCSIQCPYIIIIICLYNINYKFIIYI